MNLCFLPFSVVVSISARKMSYFVSRGRKNCDKIKRNVFLGFQDAEGKEDIMKIIEYGNPEGKRILCIPGVFMAAECFRRLSQELPEYRLVCVTLDGFHPGSEEFGGLEQQTEKLVRMLRDRGTTSFEMVLGLSMGTIFSVRLAKNPALKIRKLFLDGAVNFYRSKVKYVVQAAIYLIFRHFMITAKKDKQKSSNDLKKVYEGDWEEIIQVCRASLTEPSLRVMARLLADYTLEPGVEQPMYLIFGGKEDNIKVNSRVVRALYPDARIMVKEGYNHLEYLNRQPEEYGKLVRKVLEK